MAIKNEKKLQQKEQNKDEAVSKQKASDRQERRNSIPPLEQRREPKQETLNEAPASAAGNAVRNIAANAATSALMDAVPAKLAQQYADRAERQYGNPRQEIANGSIDPQIDTVYRVGPYDASGFYTQSQLNNNMSGPDANAIYQATHDQRMRNTYRDKNAALNQLANSYLLKNGDERTIDESVPGGEALAQAYRYLGLKPNTARQTGSAFDGYDAYVSGADASAIPGINSRLPMGYGSYEGIPSELIDPEYMNRFLSDYYSDILNSIGYRLPTR